MFGDGSKTCELCHPLNPIFAVENKGGYMLCAASFPLGSKTCKLCLPLNPIQLYNMNLPLDHRFATGGSTKVFCPLQGMDGLGGKAPHYHLGAKHALENKYLYAVENKDQYIA